MEPGDRKPDEQKPSSPKKTNRRDLIKGRSSYRQDCNTPLSSILNTARGRQDPSTSNENVADNQDNDILEEDTSLIPVNSNTTLELSDDSDDEPVAGTSFPALLDVEASESNQIIPFIAQPDEEPTMTVMGMAESQNDEESEVDTSSDEETTPIASTSTGLRCIESSPQENTAGCSSWNDSPRTQILKSALAKKRGKYHTIARSDETRTLESHKKVVMFNLLEEFFQPGASEPESPIPRKRAKLDDTSRPVKDTSKPSGSKNNDKENEEDNIQKHTPEKESLEPAQEPSPEQQGQDEQENEGLHEQDEQEAEEQDTTDNQETDEQENDDQTPDSTSKPEPDDDDFKPPPPKRSKRLVLKRMQK